jgi:uncharacterized protein (TIGR02246 family)
MAPSTSAEIQDVCSSICEKFTASYNQGDAEGLAALYTENAQILPPNMDFVEGRQAIQTFWQDALEMGIKSFKTEMIEAEGSGDMGYLVGKYTLYGEGEQLIDKGKYIAILKQVDGQWKVHRDIFNSSMPLEKH